MTSSPLKFLQMYLHVLDENGNPVRRLIGHLSQFGDIMRVSFEPSYINDPKRPTLSLSYRGVDETASEAILSAQTDSRVARNDGHWPNFFSNLLPEHHNRKRLARERGCSEDDEFELLAAAGHDLMGALEVQPMPMGKEIPDAVQAWHVSQGLEITKVLRVEEPVEDGASIPGVVDKFSAIKDGRRYIIKRHNAAGSYIIKLPSTKHPDLVENEFTGFQLCRAVNLNCAEAEIIDREEVDLPDHLEFPRLLAVKRFDREHIELNFEEYSLKRVAMEEFCQILDLPPNKKYGTAWKQDYASIVATLANLSGEPITDLKEFISRFVAFILMGNCDAHLKNWAVLYEDGVTPRLSPLYDPVCVSAMFDPGDANQYAYNKAVDAMLTKLEWKDLEEMLQIANLPTRRITQLRQAARETVRLAQARWPAILKDAPVKVAATVLARINGGVALSLINAAEATA